MNNNLKSFTMAEILLSLTIIGVVAAITLPSLTGNINERTWDTQRKALYARMSQAIALMGSINGYGQYAGSWSANSVSVTTDNTAKAFLTDGLSKVYKINNICDAQHLSDCGLPDKIINMSNSKINFPKKLSELNNRFVEDYTNTDGTIYSNPLKYVDTAVAAMETQNGESIAVYYNPLCNFKPNATSMYILPRMCVNFIYDLNGKKGPNSVGKDINFMTVFNSSDSVVVAPVFIKGTANYNGSNPTSQRQAMLACKAKGENIMLPNIDELAAGYVNKGLFNMTYASDVWSSSVYDNGSPWRLSAYSGRIRVLNSSPGLAYCVKK